MKFLTLLKGVMGPCFCLFLFFSVEENGDVGARAMTTNALLAIRKNGVFFFVVYMD